MEVHFMYRWKPTTRDYPAALERSHLMSDIKSVRAARLDRLGDVLRDVEGVHLRHLQPFTTVFIQTMHSLYRVVIIDWPEVRVQGGTFFPEPTPAFIDGATLGGSCLRIGWIGVGLFVEIRSAGRRIITSPVRAINTALASSSVVP